MQDLWYLLLIVIFAALTFGLAARLRRAGSAQMSGLYLICGVVALALFVYLLVALFNAENL